MDYHGLWAEVLWEEWRGKSKELRKEKLIRFGRRWYFYHEDDRALIDLGPTKKSR